MAKKNKQQPENKPEVNALFNPEIERVLLGQFMLSPTTFYQATAEGLKPEHFHLSANRMIFMAMADIQDAGVNIDALTLSHYLESQGQLESAGGIAYLASLVDGVPERPNVGWQVGVLKECALRCRLHLLGQRIEKMAADPTEPISLVVAGTHDDLLQMQGESHAAGIRPLSDTTDEVIRGIEEMMSYDPYRTIGIPFGLSELDEATSGMRTGEFIVLAAWAKAGKTSFAIDTVRKVARSGIPVGFFSREMRRSQLLERVFSQEGDIAYAKIRKPMNLSISEFRHLQKIKQAIDGWPLFIDDDATEISQMIPRAHLMVRTHKVQLIVVDYLQIVGAPFDKEYERVSHVANVWTAFAKSTGVPVLGLSQLTKPDGKKSDVNVMPTVGMLRSSGQIEQNAHLIVLLHHPVDKETGVATGEDLAIIGAQRAGPTGRCKCFFNTSCQRWEERGLPSQPAPQQEEIFEQEAASHGN